MTRQGKIVHSAALAEAVHPQHDRYLLKDLLVQKEGGGLSLHRGRIEPGGEVFVHTHDMQAETFYILSGEAKCAMGEEKYAFFEGSCGFAPPRHSPRHQEHRQHSSRTSGHFYPPLK